MLYDKCDDSVVAPNPNPLNFEIIQCAGGNGNCVIWVKYPDCTNYEGNKILVFRGVSVDEVKGLTELDPHFSDKSNISPFARFEPTKDGWDAALALMQII